MPAASRRESPVTQPIGRSIGFLALGLALTLPCSAAAAPRAGLLSAPTAPATAQPASPNLAGQLWTFLVSLWVEGGCIADPNGCHAQNGGLAPAESAPGGCIIDPSGACTSTASSQPTDAGCIADPDGCR
jgi:hypothetical protein